MRFGEWAGRNLCAGRRAGKNEKNQTDQAEAGSSQYQVRGTRYTLRADLEAVQAFLRQGRTRAFESRFFD